MFLKFIHNYIINNEISDNLWNILYKSEIKPIKLNKIYIKRDSWLQCGYDFHCVPYILQIIASEYPMYDEDEIKKAIWFCNSSKNLRIKLKVSNKCSIVAKKPICKEFIVIWQNISKTFYKKAWGYIQRVTEELNSLFPEKVEYTDYSPNNNNKD